MKEIWKSVVGYEGSYEVSSYGNVRSVTRKVRTGKNYTRTVKGKILRQHVSRNGYKFLSLCKNGKYTGCFVHVLVAKAFLPNPNNYPIVNHKSQEKTDNRVENLEWCTYLYNNTYGGLNEKKMKPVDQFTADGLLVKSYKSLTDAAMENGYMIGNISNCCRGVIKQYKGYKWSYRKR